MTLDKKLKRIEKLDVSNIKKLDMIQEAKELERDKNQKDTFWKITPRKDTFTDEIMMGYGVGSAM